MHTPLAHALARTALAMTTLLLTMLELAACSPTLTDGRYACPDGRCPSGWSCHADRVCRIAAPSDAGTDAAAPDSPSVDAQAPFLTSCTTDEACGGMRCYRGDDDDWAAGYCTPACREMAACSGLMFSPFCNDVVRACVVLCDETDTSCPPGFRCIGVFREAEDPDSTLGECRPLAVPIPPSSRATCTEDLDCAVEENCSDMRCARPCARGVLPCAEGDVCTATSIGDLCIPT